MIQFLLTQIAKLKADVSSVKSAQKMYADRLSFDGTEFKVTKAAKDNKAYCIIARNNNDGAVYALWYRSASTAFRVGYVINGNQPSEGDTVDVFYPID